MDAAAANPSPRSWKRVCRFAAGVRQEPAPEVGGVRELLLLCVGGMKCYSNFILMKMKCIFYAQSLKIIRRFHFNEL